MSQVVELEQQLKDGQYLAERRAAALRLYQNKDFKRIIVDEFCGSEAARYVQTSGDPALKPEERADALNIAQASGHVKRFLSMVVQMGAVAERDLVSLQEAIEEARAEDQGERD